MNIIDNLNHEKSVESLTKFIMSWFISVNLPKTDKGFTIKFIHFINNTPKKEVNIICIYALIVNRAAGKPDR